MILLNVLHIFYSVIQQVVDLKVIQKSSKNDLKMVQKLSKNHLKMV